MAERLKTSLTYKGKTVDMDDKAAAEGLIAELVTDRYPELKGGKMPGVRIEIKRVEGLNLKPKEDKIVLTMDAFMSPGDMARLRYLSGQGVPVSATIESPQAMFDLKVQEINLETGEIVHSKEAILAAATDVRD